MEEEFPFPNKGKEVAIRKSGKGSNWPIVFSFFFTDDIFHCLLS